MAVMVRRSACRGSKSVDARTISSPTRQPAAFRTWIEVAPALAVLRQLGPGVLPVAVQVQGSARDHDPAVTHAHQLFILDVVGEGDGGLARVGAASVPMASSPCNMIHSVVSSRSALLAKLSLPSMVRPPSAGGLTSRITSLPLAMVHLVACARAPSCLARWPDQTSSSPWPPAGPPERQRIRCRAGVPEPAMQEGLSDIVYSWHFPQLPEKKTPYLSGHKGPYLIRQA